MGGMRIFAKTHRQLAALLLAAALCLKVLVPAGFMPVSDQRLLTISICADTVGQHVTRQIAVPVKPDPASQHHAAKGDCAFTALSVGALGGTDAFLLAIALAFVLALGFVPVRIPELRGAARLRPPLRGPPLAA